MENQVIETTVNQLSKTNVGIIIGVTALVGGALYFGWKRYKKGKNAATEVAEVTSAPGTMERFATEVAAKFEKEREDLVEEVIAS